MIFTNNSKYGSGASSKDNSVASSWCFCTKEVDRDIWCGKLEICNWQENRTHILLQHQHKWNVLAPSKRKCNYGTQNASPIAREKGTTAPVWYWWGPKRTRKSKPIRKTHDATPVFRGKGTTDPEERYYWYVMHLFVAWLITALYNWSYFCNKVRAMQKEQTCSCQPKPGSYGRFYSAPFAIPIQKLSAFNKLCLFWCQVDEEGGGEKMMIKKQN